MSSSPVFVRREPVLLPTYEPLAPDKNPMFLERRVYQGSSGKVYPLPFYNRISETKHDRLWDAVYIENEYIEVMILPEIGGRIHAGRDKTNGYEFFYRQSVIKPALVGLAGPWASGGVEFNWPQHHRPATFMPVDVEIEHHSDGSKTVWLSDHDPMQRMKGMHGVCVHPGRAIIELKMRAYNRTPYVQTFLWWANVATHVHEGYQSFFPPDVVGVADHAKRAMSSFPLSEGTYYGINYADRATNGVPEEQVPSQFLPPHCAPKVASPEIPAYAPNDLTWYSNIPVPTSYMCIGSEKDFSGGYDFKKRAGLVQISNHHISPGKKQWTWGNHTFGYAWDRNLTDKDGPYIELMLGVYTDNQPDFSFLQPGETKAWSVFWFPFQAIGPVEHADTRGAVSLRTDEKTLRIGVATTEAHPNASIELFVRGQPEQSWQQDLAPDRPFATSVSLAVAKAAIEIRVRTSAGEPVLSYRPQQITKQPLPPPAAEPPQPECVASTDELYTIGLHLAQYRHATRSPALYWKEALRRDVGDARCNNALGIYFLRRGEFELAENHFRAAIARITSRNPNPYDGEPFYNLGLALRFLGRIDDAYGAFYKATWNQSWQAAGYLELALIDCTRGDWPTALDHLDRSVRLNTDSLRALDLRSLVLRKMGRHAEAARQLSAALALDPLNWSTRHIRGDQLTCDNQVRLDLAWDLARGGFYSESVEILQNSRVEALSGTGPMIGYTLGYLYSRLGDKEKSREALRRASEQAATYCFPSRLEEILVLEWTASENVEDARAPYYLGNLLYDKQRYEEAMAHWEKSAKADPTFPTVWRNLGIAYFNVRRNPEAARAAYERAFAADPSDARIFYERDQLWQRCGESPASRLREFQSNLKLVGERDDASIELCALHNQTGQPHEAQRILSHRAFQPWEGGEGLALGQHVRTHLLLGREALNRSDFEQAICFFQVALAAPENLGEAKHLLANQSNVDYWLGAAYSAAGDADSARRHWTAAANSRGDFQEMRLKAYSEMTYFSARTLEHLGHAAEAQKLFNELLQYAGELCRTSAKIDYFATSLPTLLLFDDDLDYRQQTTGIFLGALALHGLGRLEEARRDLEAVLRRDPSHAGASDMFSDVPFMNRSGC